MMLFDPTVGPSIKGRNVAGRQGGGKEIMSATVKQRKTGSGVKPEKGHLTPEVKVANEITCDHIRDNLYPPPISVTCSKWYIRKAPLFSGLSLWTRVC
jgi:hypothetical protein